MERFASGWKRNYYGKGDVIVYRLDRTARAGEQAVFGARVLMLVYGDAFWPTYTTGDNTGLIATDSMKNFIQRETLDFTGRGLDAFCRHLGEKFLARYPQVEGAQVSAEEIPYRALEAGVGFVPGGPERATARIELTRERLIETTGGIRGFRLLRLGGSAFHGFVRDEYTTLPDLKDRPLHMWLDVEWQPTAGTPLEDADAVARVRSIVHRVFETFESGSIQQVIYQIGTAILDAIPGIGSVVLEADNRTWDTIAEREGTLGVYTDARPPYGCLGLRLTRDRG